MVANQELRKNNGMVESELEKETITEEGPKLVRTKPMQNNDFTDTNHNNNGKVNVIFILLIISLILIAATFIVLFNLG